MDQTPILVGIDFSDGAAAAVSRAALLGRQFGAPVVALHVVEGADRDWSAEQLAWMEALALNPERVIARRGVSWMELARVADEIRAGMVVVGSHGRTGYQPLCPGSTAWRLLTRSHQPVLVVLPPRDRTPSAAEPLESATVPWKPLSCLPWHL